MLRSKITYELDLFLHFSTCNVSLTFEFKLLKYSKMASGQWATINVVILRVGHQPWASQSQSWRRHCNKSDIVLS